MSRTRLLLILAGVVSAMSLQSLKAAEPAAKAADGPCYELRTYYAAPGKLDALNARFRDHTMALFEKHGMVNVGYWMPADNPDHRLIYVLGFPSRAAATQSWSKFGSDPDWQKVVRESEADGKLVTRVESVYLKATDYSPAVRPAKAAGAPRLFELRTYTAAPGRLEALHTRFRDHTCRLFEKHGMSNFAYWTPMDPTKGSDNTLVYIVAHKDKGAAEASWKAFQADAIWVAARKASEEKAGGSLTVADGVKSVYMIPTDYSPTR